MNLTIEVTNTVELETILQFFKDLKFENVKITDSTHTSALPTIEKGDKSLNPKELWGIWQDAPRDLKEIRTNNWKRDWKL